MPVARIPIAGVSTARHSILIVRDGEHLLPWIAAAITAVRRVSARRWQAPAPDQDPARETGRGLPA
jgi:hypothetical protein